MTDLFLIAHRVRGEPAFDIATPLDVLDEDGDPIWIIPTSGHRARPYWWTELDWLMCGDTVDGYYTMTSHVPPMPADLLDHYHLEQTVRTSTRLIDRLNLHRPLAPPIVRRI